MNLYRFTIFSLISVAGLTIVPCLFTLEEILAFISGGQDPIHYLGTYVFLLFYFAVLYWSFGPGTFLQQGISKEPTRTAMIEEAQRLVLSDLIRDRLDPNLSNETPDQKHLQVLRSARISRLNCGEGVASFSLLFADESPSSQVVSYYDERLQIFVENSLSLTMNEYRKCEVSVWKGVPDDGRRLIYDPDGTLYEGHTFGILEQSIDPLHPVVLQSGHNPFALHLSEATALSLRHLDAIEENDPFHADGHFLRMLYFSGVTISTLGFGDIVPLTHPARFCVLIQTFLGVYVLGLILASATRT